MQDSPGCKCVLLRPVSQIGFSAIEKIGTGLDGMRRLCLYSAGVARWCVEEVPDGRRYEWSRLLGVGELFQEG
jgi:hypothetical protein